MRVVSYETGFAPKSLVVVSGVGRALNPTDRSGKPKGTNLSSSGYDNKQAKHRVTNFVPEGTYGGTVFGHFEGGGLVNNFRTEAFDTPVKVWRKNSGWMTVAGGKDGLTITYAPDAVVVFAVVEGKGEEEDIVITGMPLSEYMDTYC